MALTKKQLTYLEKRLLEERARALKNLGFWDAESKQGREQSDSALQFYSDHMADQGTEAMEREKQALFATKEGRYLHRIEGALRRMYDDPKTFGTCVATGADIAFERLDAVPHARYCIEYKRQLESGEVDPSKASVPAPA